jgi:hypothetical protein
MGEAKRRRDLGLPPKGQHAVRGCCHSCGRKLGKGRGRRQLPNGLAVCPRCYGERNPLGTVHLAQRQRKALDDAEKPLPRHLLRVPDAPLHKLRKLMGGS